MFGCVLSLAPKKKTIGHLDSAAITSPAKLYKRTRFKVIFICDEQNTQILINPLFNHVTIVSEQQPHERVTQKQKDFDVRNRRTYLHLLPVIDK